ncbi:glycoside hydrolase family 3 C-terminal domain-containing protein [uncultured Serinicoccus sp.]|uniref:beta-glucosidase family protein n=1 Tax=uncultured Serinicoccus sp. TaxID=735514 RepID=UPI002626BCEA|nr:glycoside hydrolase family 3 C-terminal domain-containing protein [uncultured Serinicoccus sp.]
MDHTRAWQDPALAPRERAQALVAVMSTEQKIAQLHGNMDTIDIYALSNEMFSQEVDAEEMEQLATQIRIERHVKGINDLGIPRMRVTNGPVGVGMGDGTPSPPATALPMTIGVAASFDPDLAYAYGDIIGAECRHLGQHVLEGPGVCLHRTPIGGRNFEYFSEDPYLSGLMGVQVTRAIQDHGVIAMAKHYVVNDQEHERFRANVEVAEHVLRELYLLPFEMCCKDAEIGAIMSAYNRVRGTYATENRYTLNTILRDEWGWEGYVQSDFWSCRSAAPSLNAGLDLEMPDAKWLNWDNVTAALHDFSLEIETIDRALVRRFTQMFRFGQFDRPYAPTEIPAAEHGAVSRHIGQQMAVLLKNDAGRLPLATDLGRVLVVGMDTFAARACQGGGGSSKVDPLYTVDPLPGMRDVLADLGSGTSVDLMVAERDLSNLDEVVAAASVAEVDAVVVMAGLVATEGADLASARLPYDQDTLVSAVLEARQDAIIVLKNSTPVVLPWAAQADTVLEVWNQGAEDGHVVADLIFGQVNPSGKVPTTYADSEHDLLHHDDPVRYPGTDEGSGYPTMRYTEGLQVGYRWFQAQGISPLFPFGHGLSYTTFELSDVVVPEFDGNSPLVVTATVTNTGARDGAEVVQAYLQIPSENQPPKRLVGFAKVTVAPGSSEQVEIIIDPAATHKPFSVWDYATGTFQIRPGDYLLHVGNSSEDTPHTSTVTVPAPGTPLS